ncbi:hypothetical protein [Streptomyces griseomycini]|uniref:Peptidoglycan binding-like domain-containing protein n=1 Tax=Streptomyces griseomycini TaxID=66895 RepID=A0A7W7PNK0_9ACTN|nr:hypothetical protein [Streptomyces griseomycini]MBB4896509.1 hypothetical protein [Streptomyces griseomycini]GGP84809.1 hypothetical protein GCM10010266_03650 [Streptomyces griseomycini]GGR01881.1 hypothetical protein GCM10015536_03300 [Streptomyces griseomycini]
MNTYKRFRRTAMATVLAGGAVLGGFTATGAAHASEDTGVVDGSGNTHDDWGDEGTLKKGDEGSTVALWQTVLMADGAYWKDSEGTLQQFTEDDISGEYDSRTASATKYWQMGKGLDQTGKANPDCFSYADDNLGTVNKKGKIVYEGAVDDVTFKRKTVAGYDEQVYYVDYDDSYVPATY